MKRLLIVASLLTLSGCASIFSGTSQTITLRTTPGASYAVTDSYGQRVASGQSEGTATLTRGAGYFSPHAYKARITKPGYQPRTVEITPGINPWYFANILIGGVVGMIIVDPLTGAMYKFYPSEIDAQLEPNESTASIHPDIKVNNSKKPSSLVSRHEYAASQRARELGCKFSDSPISDGKLDPHETLVFACTDGRQISVSCSITGCT